MKPDSGWQTYKEGRKIFYSESIADRNDQQALELFDNAIELGIKDAYADRAYCLQSLEYHYEAIEDFNEALKITPDDANLFFGRGHSRKIIADYDLAIVDLTLAVQLSKLPTKLNEAYNDEIENKLGWDSPSSFYSSQLKDAIWRKENNFSYKNHEIKHRPKKSG